MKKVLRNTITSILLSLAFLPSLASAYDPVVFVHGYLGSTLVNFTSMIAKFKAAGYPSDHLSYYTYNSINGVNAGANTLKSKVDALLQKTGKSKVDIVTHSMGGLVARYYMKVKGGASKVDQIVNVATPHKGTAWAYAALGQAGKDMRPGSSVINKIKGYYPGLNLYSWCDEIVIPYWSAKVGNSKNIGCWEHIATTWSSNVISKTMAYVKP